MQGILKGTSKVMENLALKRPPLQIFAAQTAGQVLTESVLLFELEVSALRVMDLN